MQAHGMCASIRCATFRILMPCHEAPSHSCFQNPIPTPNLTPITRPILASFDQIEATFEMSCNTVAHKQKHSQSLLSLSLSRSHSLTDTVTHTYTHTHTHTHTHLPSFNAMSSRRSLSRNKSEFLEEGSFLALFFERDHLRMHFHE